MALLSVWILSRPDSPDVSSEFTTAAVDGDAVETTTTGNASATPPTAPERATDASTLPLEQVEEPPPATTPDDDMVGLVPSNHGAMTTLSGTF